MKSQDRIIYLRCFHFTFFPLTFNLLLRYIPAPFCGCFLVCRNYILTFILLFINFFKLHPDSNCSSKISNPYKTNNLFLSTIKRRELSCFLQFVCLFVFKSTVIPADAPLQSFYLEHHFFIPLSNVILALSESTYFCYCLHPAGLHCIIPFS